MGHVGMVNRNPNGRNTPRYIFGLLIPEAGCVGECKELADKKVGLGARVKRCKEITKLDVQKA